MVFQGKIPDETRVLVRIAQKFRGMRQREIMERFRLSRSTVYRILKEEKIVKRSRVPQKKQFSRTTAEIKRPSRASPFKADRLFT